MAAAVAVGAAAGAAAGGAAEDPAQNNLDDRLASPGTWRHRTSQVVLCRALTVDVTRLPAGLRVVTETVPGAASVALGFYVGTGSRDEPDGLAGASHFLEHLLFKGTEARGARALAEAVDAVGGDLNAYTAHEHTAFHIRLPAAELPLGLDVLSEVTWNPALRAGDVEAERAVILEELAMEEDTPDDRVLTLLADALYPGHPLGREVLGTRASIAAIRRDDVAAFHGRWYRPANVVVAASGALEHDDVVDGVRSRLGALTGGEVPGRTAPRRDPRPRAVLRRRAEQAHVAVGVRGLPREDDDRFALAVANQVLGGGTASRLFQSVREERGLAYSVHSWVEAHVDTGALVAYAGTAIDHLGEVLALLEDGLRSLAEGVTADEVRVAAGYLSGSTVLALEDPGSRMARNGEALLATGRVTEVDEVLDGFRSVTPADVSGVVRRLLDAGAPTVAVLAPGRALRGVRTVA